jgi:S1-C subfamily serine protease
VLTFSGATLRAEIVAFDPDADLAVLSVPELRSPPLPMAAPKVGMVGAVYGHPGGGPLAVIPARIAQSIVAVGTDIYRTSNSRRRVLVLATRLEPGDSGGALVNTAGNVVGVAFATDPGRANTDSGIDARPDRILPRRLS